MVRKGAKGVGWGVASYWCSMPRQPVRLSQGKEGEGLNCTEQIQTQTFKTYEL